jgi:hypothetical protein
MKNLIAMALIATFLLASCRKTYTCACTFVDSTGKTTQATIGQMNTTKSKAQKSCNDEGNSYKSVYTSVSCHL